MNRQLVFLFFVLISTQLNAETPAPVHCDVNQGFRLLNQNNPSADAIKNILNLCDQENPNDLQVLLLHGLFARSEGLKHQEFSQAILWFQKAVQAAPSDPTPAIELAVTYEWANQLEEAKSVYKQILIKTPDSKPALLGLARIALAQSRMKDAEQIYEALLKNNPQDPEILNGLGRIGLLKNNFADAEQFFNKTLQNDPNNADARTGLQELHNLNLQKLTASSVDSLNKSIQLMYQQNMKKTHHLDKLHLMTASSSGLSHSTKLIHERMTMTDSACPVQQGLELLNKPKPDFVKIKKILSICDRTSPHHYQVLLLHGLTARKEGMDKQDYQAAIDWLSKAVIAAPNHDHAASLELATTYEWSKQPQQAREIYEKLLEENPTLIPAQIGLAMTALAQFRFEEAERIYRRILEKNPGNTEALNGLGLLNLANKDFDKSKQYYTQALQLQPNNADAVYGLKQLETATKNTAAFIIGRYTQGDQQSTETALGYKLEVNATDNLYVLATHNSNPIFIDFILQPTVLPKNSLFIDFQRQFSERYGWGLSAEYRDHSPQNTELKLGGNFNLYLSPNVQVLGGTTNGFPSPWNNQLYYSGLTFFTKAPFDITTTGYWANQQFGGFVAAYAFDLSKEFSNTFFYDVGASYTVQDSSWAVHGRMILPIFKNNAILALYERYFFNNATHASLGWQVKW